MQQVRYVICVLYVLYAVCGVFVYVVYLVPGFLYQVPGTRYALHALLVVPTSLLDEHVHPV